MKVPTVREVVDSICAASSKNAAYKAHATRKLNLYVSSRCKNNSAKPTQIVAGVRAAVTKRKKSMLISLLSKN